jgi:hypothetical protein
MLALTDTQLSMLAIAATAVPSSQRGRWLRGVADRIDPPPHRLAIARARKGRHRARQPSQPGAPITFP